MTVEKKGIDPFEVDVIKTLEKLRSYLPKWKLLEELLLDAEAVNHITSIIKLQGDWVMRRSSSLYIDPLLVELKIKMLDKGRLAQCFLRSRHAVVALEQLSSDRMKEAVKYWNMLLPLEERFVEEGVPMAEKMSLLSPEDLINLRIVSPEEFLVLLEDLWKELKAKGKISYQGFVYTDSFEETVNRAYLTSFLVTGGYAELEVKPIEEEVFLIARRRPLSVRKQKKVHSVPVAIDYSDWKKYRGEGDG